MHEELKNKYYYHIKANKNYFYGSENYFCYLASVSIYENIFLKVFVVPLCSVYGEDASSSAPFQINWNTLHIDFYVILKYKANWYTKDMFLHCFLL